MPPPPDRLPVTVAAVATELETIIRDGFIVDPDTVHFIASTVDDPRPQAVASLVQDPTDATATSLAELIFFPDKAIKLRLERLLSPFSGSAPHQHVLNPQEVDQLTDYLSSLPLTTRLVFRPTRETIGLRFPAAAIRPLVGRLRLTKALPKRIIQTMAAHVHEHLRLKIMVRLRDSGLDFRNSQEDVLIDYLQRMDHYSDPNLVCCQFIIDFISIRPRIEDLTTALIEHQRSLGRQLQRALQFESRFSQSNMETLLLSGHREPHLYPAGLQTAIALIDHILAAQPESVRKGAATPTNSGPVNTV